MPRAKLKNTNRPLPMPLAPVERKARKAKDGQEGQLGRIDPGRGSASLQRFQQSLAIYRASKGRGGNEDKKKHEAFVERKKQRSGWQSGNDVPRPKFDSQLPGETYRRFANRLRAEATAVLYAKAEDTGNTKRQREKKKERAAERKERKKEAKVKRQAEMDEPQQKPDIAFGERNDAPLDRLAAPMRRMRETGTDIVHRKDTSQDDDAEKGDAAGEGQGKKRRGKGKKVEDMQLTLARQSLIEQYRAKKSRKRLDPAQFIM